MLIPNGMRDVRKEISLQERLLIRKKYHISKDEKIILFVGRLQPSKGVSILINAFKLVIKKYENCRLVLVGIGLDSDFTQAIKQCDQVWSKITFTGAINRQVLFNWYHIAEIGVIPSYSEQCSCVGMEMMMFHLPIVASDAYGVRNMFNEGCNALIAKIGDRNNDSEFVKTLANRILELLLNVEKKKQLALNARKMYEERYTIEIMRNRYKKLLCDL